MISVLTGQFIGFAAVVPVLDSLVVECVLEQFEGVEIGSEREQRTLYFGRKSLGATKSVNALLVGYCSRTLTLCWRHRIRRNSASREGVCVEGKPFGCCQTLQVGFTNNNGHTIRVILL